MSRSASPFDGRTLLLAIIAIIALIAWQIIGGGLAVALLGAGGLLAVYLFLKGVFAAFIVGLAALFGRLRAVGLAGSVRPGSIIYGLPLIALSALLALPLLQDGLTIPVSAAIGWSLMALFVSIGEETVFRGVLHRAVAPMGYWATAVITSVSFGAVHLLGLFSAMPPELIFVQSLMAACIGLVFFLVRQSEGSLWTVLFLHWLIDSCAFVAGGGITVPENVTETMIGMLAVAAVMLGWAIPAMIIQKRRVDKNAAAPADPATSPAVANSAA
ncbi:CPBP family intramembrane glutamic endopeptidase [Hyphobacterium sp.]|uniref:CPBP family intramembrane glutamic endopeptidase n=1 Tax=Hyphobacterium sp. TaxID=2004662 RepID=UPI003BA9E35E